MERMDQKRVHYVIADHQDPNHGHRDHQEMKQRIKSHVVGKVLRLVHDSPWGIFGDERLPRQYAILSRRMQKEKTQKKYGLVHPERAQAGQRFMKDGKYIGAIDQGTTSTRFMVFDRAGRIVASAQKEHAQIYPKPGWVEHDPEEIWQRTQQVIDEAMAQGGLQVTDLAAIGITN